jgi:hypothetical protein
MVTYLGPTPADAYTEVIVTRRSHDRFTYLRALPRSHLRDASQSKMVGDVAIMRMYRDWAVRTYLLFVVDTTIFSNKAKNYVDLTYLQYLREIQSVITYAWGLAALSFLYRELRNATAPKCRYLAGYATLLHVTYWRTDKGQFNPEGT